MNEPQHQPPNRTEEEKKTFPFQRVQGIMYILY